ncbi:MAG: hypothetical protein U1C58_08395 [Flavobacteriaceae bacterium]|nr:hypothetical protein [Flavobacteriaceae bacterium]MDZ4148287.1 hypothetical protein [Flavobacteriaceae bacterium]
MKKLILPLLLVVFAIGQAQIDKKVELASNKQAHQHLRSQDEKRTPAERANLQTKRMALHLDLTESQQKSVNTLLLKQNEQRDLSFAALKKDKEAGKQPTDAERYQQQVNRLDSQIAFQKEMKSILNEKQYEQWKNQREKSGKRMMMKKHHHKQQN